VIKPFIAANKTKGKLKAKTTDAPRKTHNAWSNKNIVSWKVTWFLPMKKGVPRGHPQPLTIVLLGYLLGCVGIPKLELLSIFQLTSSFSNPYTWKLPSYKTKHNSISNISVSITLHQPFLLQVLTQNHHI
jgi:hypothetical protein